MYKGIPQSYKSPNHIADNDPTGISHHIADNELIGIPQIYKSPNHIADNDPTCIPHHIIINFLEH